MFPRDLLCDKVKLRCNEASCVGHIIIIFCLQTNKAKQSYVWIESRFEAQNIYLVVK